MTESETFRDQQLARLARALGAPMRVRILELLAQTPRTVERIAADSGQSVANTSQHLRVLREARLVEATRNGNFLTYHLASPDIATLLVCLGKIAEQHLAELRAARDALTRRTADVERIDRRTLLRRLREGSAILIDVRPAEEYAAGHIAGALSFPLSELHTRIGEIPSRREVVAYCRGPYCMLAVDAVRLLRRRGRAAKRLEDGVAEWRSAGLRVAGGKERA